MFRYALKVKGREGHKEHPDRRARVADLAVRARAITIKLTDRRSDRVHRAPLNASMLRESRTVPRGEKPIEWYLLTNHPISTREEVERVIFGYAQRWRIEEFHKTWKSGCCSTEQTQLHSSKAVMRWATILAAVAARVEHLKYRSRTSPDDPATVELSAHEIRALRLLRTEYGPRKEQQPDELTLGVAVRWIADLGGYTGKSSGGPPGSITIRRGLERLEPAAQVLQLIERPPK